MAMVTEDTKEDESYIGVVLKYLKILCPCLSVWGLGYFHFSPTWIALGTISYLFVERARERKKRLSSSIKAIGQDEKKFILEHFTIKDLPSWVYFPDVERAEWLNQILKRMWPFVSKYFQEIFENTLEPSISDSLPEILKPFKFTTIDLGDTLRGTLRVVMKPLLPQVPFTGAVTVCFLDSPYINFTLTDMGNVLSFPGLLQTLHSVIRDVVNNLVVLPNRLPIQLVNEVDIQRLKFPMPEGVLHIHVMSARHLIAADKNVIGKGSSDPYCIIRVGARKFVTKVIKTSLEPTWNEYFETPVDIAHGQSLEVEVWDKDQGNKDDKLGIASLPMESIFSRGSLDTWVQLEEVKTGSVHLNLSWFDLSNNPSDFAEATSIASNYRNISGKAMSSGLLYVVVEQATNLQRVKKMQEPSPFCSIRLGSEIQRTECKDRTPNPVWESAHQFMIADPEMDTLQIIIRDSKTETKLGTCTVPVKMLLTQRKMSVNQPFRLQETGPEESSVHLYLSLSALVPKPDSSTVEDGKQLKSTQSQDVDGLIDPIQGSSNSASSDSVVRNRLDRSQSYAVESSVEASGVQGTVAAKTDIRPASMQETAPVLNHVSPMSSIPDPSPKSDDNEAKSPSTTPFGRIRLTLQYHSNSDHLEVIVLRAENLKGVDKDGLSDPYIKLTLIDAKGNQFGEKRKTKPQKNTLTPVYNEAFDFTVSLVDLSRLQLRVDVRNHVGTFTLSGRQHDIGSVCVPISHLLDESTGSTGWFDLVDPQLLKESDD